MEVFLMNHFINLGNNNPELQQKKLLTNVVEEQK